MLYQHTQQLQEEEQETLVELHKLRLYVCVMAQNTSLLDICIASGNDPFGQLRPGLALLACQPLTRWQSQ